MPDFFEVVRTRRSIRSYQDRPVGEALLKELVDLAILAPTGMNSQPWAFTVITNRQVMAKLNERVKALLLAPALAESLVNEGLRQVLSNPEFSIFYNAPAMIIITSDPTAPTAMIDCQLAAENLFLAAHAKGLGTCYVGFLMFGREDDEVRELLHLPEGHELMAAAIVGYPGEKPGPPQRRPAPFEWVR